LKLGERGFGVVAVRVQLEGEAVGFDCEVGLAGCGVGVAEVVVSVVGFGVELEATIEDGDAVVISLLTEEKVAGGVHRLFGDGVVLELSGVGGEDLTAVVQSVMDEADVERVVGVVLDPGKGRVFAPEGVAYELRRDGEAVLTVGEVDDGVAVVEVDGDEGLEGSIVAPVPEVLGGGGLFDAPAQAPEKFLGEHCGSGVVGAVGAGGVNGDLRGLHLAKCGGGEATAAEDGFEEEGVVVRGGEEAGGGVAVVAADGSALRETLRVAEGDVGTGDGDVSGVVHAERSEDKLLHDLVERLAFYAFDGALQVDIAFAGVAEA
jgi:hypothetical protein